MRAFSVLVSNFAQRKELPAEHGLSLYIRIDDTDVVFDTGQGNLFLHNAQFMNLPLSNVKTAVVSHLHDDHAGGVPFLSRYFSMVGKTCEVIVPVDYEMPMLPALKKRKAESFENICEKVYVVTTQCVEKSGEKMDELALVADKTLFSGCCHTGIEKVLSVALKYGEINAVAGGFHNFGHTASELRSTAEALAFSGIKKVVLLHCSSMKFIRHLEDMNIECKVGYVGHCYSL